MDEPTSALFDDSAERLFERIRRITESGCGVVYISHRIREVQKIANRLTVLRDGLVSAHPIGDSRQSAGVSRSGQALLPSF